jgi:hypothetical protein
LFAHKKFEGINYTFDHLKPFTFAAALNAAATLAVRVNVTFGCHCFTEAYSADVHLPHHRYAHRGEVRAFDKTRYECSLLLPGLIEGMTLGRIYLADRQNYTYVAQIRRSATTQPYSIFFDMRNGGTARNPSVRMFVQSAYMRPLAAPRNARSWRFVSLVGQIAGIFVPPRKGEKTAQK